MTDLSRLIALSIAGYVSYRVFKDAKSRGMNATGWAIFVFLLMIIGLPAYFISRKPKLESEEDASAEEG